MSTIDQDRAIVAFFNQMRPDVPYRMRPAYWEKYQGLRAQRGLGRTDDQNRLRWTLTRRGQKLIFRTNEEVWDFEANPNPDAPAFAFAFTAFAFDDKEDLPNPGPIPDNLTWLMDFQGTDQGFWYEADGLRISGSPGSLHLHGLSQDRQAEVLQLVRSFKPNQER